VLNYKRKSTEGLSLVMVLGWVVGDLMKMIYFMIGSSQSMSPSDGMGAGATAAAMIPTEVEDGGDNMSTFIFGCIFALIMDVIVGMQVAKWYPSHDMLDLRDRLRRMWFRFKSKVLRTSGSGGIRRSSSSSWFRTKRNSSNHGQHHAHAHGMHFSSSVDGDHFTC